ncbi:hypothetical protein FRC02_000161 [Tulasnella sp. 418]|nr:hypothetical protein FRC02_000161 [Tulasnella sp. 418]
MCIGADIGGTDPDTGTGKEGDVEGRCFQRDSPRDQLVVTLFLLIVFGLLLGAAVRGRMEKAGLRLNPSSLGARASSRSWWEFYLPSGPSQQQTYDTERADQRDLSQERLHRPNSSDLLPLASSSRVVYSPE